MTVIGLFTATLMWSAPSGAVGEMRMCIVADDEQAAKYAAIRAFKETSPNAVLTKGPKVVAGCRWVTHWHTAREHDRPDPSPYEAKLPPSPTPPPAP